MTWGVTPKSPPQVTPKVEQTDITERILLFCNEGRSKKDIADDNQFNYPDEHRLHSRVQLQ